MFVKLNDIGKQHDRELEIMYQEIQKRQANIDKAFNRLKEEDRYEPINLRRWCDI